MNERITDERLVEIEAWFLEHAVQGPWEDHMDELLQALKAERSRITELEEWAVARCNELGRQIVNRDKRITELEAMFDVSREGHLAANKRITELEAALAEKTEWCIEIDELAVKLKARLKAVNNIGAEPHTSWGCSEDFIEGWIECKKLVDEVQDQSDG